MSRRVIYDCGCAECGDVTYPCDQHKGQDRGPLPAHESCETCAHHSGGAFVPAACDIGESMADGGCAWWEEA